MEEDVPADPGDIRLLGTPASVTRLKRLADSVEEPRLRWTGWVVSRTAKPRTFAMPVAGGYQTEVCNWRMTMEVFPLRSVQRYSIPSRVGNAPSRATEQHEVCPWGLGRAPGVGMSVCGEDERRTPGDGVSSKGYTGGRELDAPPQRVPFFTCAPISPLLQRHLEAPAFSPPSTILAVEVPPTTARASSGSETSSPLKRILVPALLGSRNHRVIASA